MTATTVLISTVAPSRILISVRKPATGEGISASTLSVEISKSGSSFSTWSPTFLSHLVMVPSTMDSPIWGMTMSVPVGDCAEEVAIGAVTLADAGVAPIDDGDHGIDADGGAFGDPDFAEDAGCGRRNFGVYLVGGDFEEGLVFLDAVAGLLEPFGDGALNDRLAHLGHDYVGWHESFSPRLRIAFTGGSCRIINRGTEDGGRE